MRIAQIAPLTEAIPPKLYGGTERVVSWLTEELVALGHEVTLFASGNSRDQGEARADVAARLASRRFGARSDGAAHGDAGAGAPASRRVRRPAFPPRLLSVLVVFAPAHALHHHPARPARSAGAPAGVRYVLLGAGDFDLECPAPARAAGATGCEPFITACRRNCLRRGRSKPDYLALPRPYRAGESASTGDPDRRALRAAAQDRGQGRPRGPRVFRAMRSARC